MQEEEEEEEEEYLQETVRGTTDTKDRQTDSVRWRGARRRDCCYRCNNNN
jgi:hypothetical protein